MVSFDPSTATATRFRVMFKDKKWVIPSHNDYPADASDRLSKTAAAVMDLTKDTIRSDDARIRRRWGSSTRSTPRPRPFRVGASG